MMQLFKNVASQKVRVYAYADAGHASLDAGEPVTGDAANITAYTAVDNAALGASNDTNPAEVDATNAPGYYEFDPTQSETNGDVIEWYPKSSTAGVQVKTVGGDVQVTMPQYLPDVAIESDGQVHADVKEIEGVDATNQIRDAVVDDATRLDGSALNAASAAIGSDGAGLTEAGGTGDHLTAIPWNSSWDSEVQSECNDALVALGLDHLLSVAVVGTDVANNSIFARLVSASATADWDDFVNTTDSLQAVRDHIGDGANLTEAGGTGNHFTAVSWNSAWDAEVQSEVQDAIEANHLDHLLAVDYDPASKPGTATALLNELIESDAGVSRFTANALEQSPSGSGGDATLAKQNEIITDLDDIKGTGFVKDTNSLTNLSSGSTTNLSTEGETIVSSEG